MYRCFVGPGKKVRRRRERYSFIQDYYTKRIRFQIGVLQFLKMNKNSDLLLHLRIFQLFLLQGMENI